MPQRFTFDVDPAYNKKHNEYSKDVGRLQLSAGVLGLILIAIAAAVWITTHGSGLAIILAIAFGFFALFCFALIFILPRQVGDTQQVYDAFPLVPALVAEVHPRGLVIMALVDASADPQRSRPALALRNITRLEGHDIKVGERVPAVAVAGRRSVRNEGLWDEISPMPIAWGTPDRSVVDKAIAAIPVGEWVRLDKLLPRLEDVKKTRFNLLEL